MARILSFNSWFEWELDSLIRTGILPELTNPKKNRDRFLEKLFLALSNPEDYVLLDSPPPPSLTSVWDEMGWIVSSRILSKSSKIEDPVLLSRENIALQEFGSIRSWKQGDLSPDELIWRRSAYWNSRIQQNLFSRSHGLEIGGVDPKSRVIRGEEDLWDYLENQSERLSNPSYLGILFKAEFSSSGRGHILWRGPKDNHRLKKLTFPIHAEDYHASRKHDFGILFDVKEGDFGTPLAISTMLIGEDFQFKGCEFSGGMDWEEMDFDISGWKEFIYTDESGENLRYSGPAAWDGYFLESGEIRIRSEINFRWSLGRIAWEIRRKKTRLFGENSVASYGILILHSKEKEPPDCEYLLPLSLSTTEPWRILYFEKYTNH